jgi:phage FluMu gp28-like protein
MPKPSSIAAPASAAKKAASLGAKFFLPFQAKWIKDNARLKIWEKS